jgi:hypothetical protein
MDTEGYELLRALIVAFTALIGTIWMLKVCNDDARDNLGWVLFSIFGWIGHIFLVMWSCESIIGFGISMIGYVFIGSWFLLAHHYLYVKDNPRRRRLMDRYNMYSDDYY